MAVFNIDDISINSPTHLAMTSSVVLILFLHSFSTFEN